MSGFSGLRVLALESRRAAELAKLISTYGGEPIVAPAMREVPLDSNAELIAGLTDRGAIVTRVPVYQWALPEDVAPLQSAIEELAAGKIDAALFTTGIQVAHLFQVAAEMKLEEAVLQGLRRVMVAS